MPPCIALVGRPNVGKSTLFNKLTRTQDALVAAVPGLTRDRQFGEGRLGGFDYLVVDTGGLAWDAVALDARMREQTEVAIGDADLVLFMVDAKAGCTANDELLAQQLRRSDVPVLVVVNKIDGVGEDQACAEFYTLGLGQPAAIAAAHNRGLLTLIEQVQERLTALQAAAGENTGHSESASTDASEEQIDARNQLPSIAFVGRPNVGKSTLVNRLLGEERVIAFDQPGTTRDAIRIPFSRAGRDYTLIDTAGVRRRGKVSQVIEKFSIIKTLQAIESANVCVMLLDATDGVTDQDLHLLGHIIEKGRALVVAVNKWDKLNHEAREHVRETLQRRVEFLQFTRIHFISALQGSGVGDLFKSINRAHASAFVDLATPRLTRLLQLATEQHQPPMVNGRRIKLRFAHQGGVNPPIIVIHGNQIAKVPAHYERFLSHFFQRKLHLFGTPLRIHFKQGDNPYAPEPSRRPRKSRGSSKTRRGDDSGSGARTPAAGGERGRSRDGNPGRRSGGGKNTAGRRPRQGR